MRYTQESGGRLNNFAVEPKIYQAEYPSKAQQIRYIFMGIASLALVSGLIAVAFAVSKVG